MKNVCYLCLLLSLMFACKGNSPLVNNTDQPNLQQYVTVYRDSDLVTFKFAISDTWTVYQSTSPDTFDTKTPCFQTKQFEYRLKVDKPIWHRYYYKIINSENDTLVVAETHLPIQKQPNVRDLGGIVNEENKSIRWGKLFRSGALLKLKNTDSMYIQSCHIKQIIDFRTAGERMKNRLDTFFLGIDSIWLPIVTPPTNATISSFVKAKNSLALDTMFVDIYRALVLDTACQRQYRQLFKYLLTGKTTLYHCSGGKDRTGMATALVLSALNVNRDKIIANYLETNDYIEDFVNYSVAYSNDTDIVQPFPHTLGTMLRTSMMVNPSFIMTSFHLIDSRYGGMAAYLKNVLDMDESNCKKLQELYLEP